MRRKHCCWLLLFLTPFFTLAGEGLQGAAQFDFFLGQWQAENQWLLEDQKTDHFKMRTWTTKLDKAGIVEDHNFQIKEDGHAYWGTAKREYDADNDRWKCSWYDSAKQEWGPSFYLIKKGDVMTGTIEGQDKHGRYVDTIVFYNIKSDGFQWKMDRVYQGLDKVFPIGRITYTRIR